MKIILAFFFTLSATFAIAAPVLDKDGVPVVNIHGTIVKSKDAEAIASAKKWRSKVPSKRIITVGEKQMPLQEFLLTYCQGKIQNETCVRGSKILNIDMASGPEENLPKGL